MTITTEKVAAVSLSQVIAARAAVENIEATYNSDVTAKAAALAALDASMAVIGLMLGTDSSSVAEGLE